MMSEKLAKVLTSLLASKLDETTNGMCCSSDELEMVERMFINCNFTSIEYWIEAKLKKVFKDNG